MSPRLTDSGAEDIAQHIAAASLGVIRDLNLPEVEALAVARQAVESHKPLQLSPPFMGEMPGLGNLPPEVKDRVMELVREGLRSETH